MNKEIISTNAAPKAIGPYSQAVKANGFLFASGQIPIDPFTGEIVYGGIVSQTHQVCANLKAILTAEELTFVDVVKTTVFLADMNDFHAMNEVYAQYFGEQPFPAYYFDKRKRRAAAKQPAFQTTATKPSSNSAPRC